MNEMVESFLNPYRELVANISPSEFEVFCMNTLKAIAEKEQLRNYSIQHNQKIKVADGNYQIDVLIQYEMLHTQNTIICECKMYTHPVEREKVAVLYAKLQSIGAQKAILISTSGFQSGAVDYAKNHGICLIQVMDSQLKYITNCAEPTEGVRRIHEMQYQIQLAEYKMLPKFDAYEWNTDYDFPVDIIYPTDQMRYEVRSTIMTQYFQNEK